MAVSNNYEVVECKGDSSKKTFNFPFRCLRVADLVVEHVAADGSKTELAAGTDYIVQTDFDNSGGVILYPVATGVSVLSSDESLNILRKTPMTQEESEFECEHQVEAALDKNLMLIQEVDEKSDITSKMIEAATESSALTVKKVLELSTKIENLVVESSSMAVQPQTIVKGAVGSIPNSWEYCWCDKPAQHIIIPQEVDTVGSTGGFSSSASLTSGSTELIIQAGLQVAAGVEGRTVLSNELESDTVLDISSICSQTSGTYYVYTDIDAAGDMSFGYTGVEPIVGLARCSKQVNEILTISNVGVIDTAFSSNAYSNRESYLAFNNVHTNSNYGFYNDLNFNGNEEPWIVGFYRETKVKVTGIRLFDGYQGQNRNIKNFTIQGTNDLISGNGTSSTQNAVNWVVLDSFIGDQNAKGACQEFLFTSTQEYKAYRLVATSQFENADYEPTIFGLEFIGIDGDFYNTSTHTHYDNYGNIIKRVYIGEFDISTGRVLNYQHGMSVTLPVNDGEDITSDSKYYVDRPFMGNCVSQVRIYHENKWGGAGWMHWYSNASGARGTTSNFTDGLLSIQTGYTSLTTNSCYCGGEFTTVTNSAPAKVTVTREW